MSDEMRLALEVIAEQAEGLAIYHGLQPGTDFRSLAEFARKYAAAASPRTETPAARDPTKHEATATCGGCDHYAADQRCGFDLAGETSPPLPPDYPACLGGFSPRASPSPSAARYHPTYTCPCGDPRCGAGCGCSLTGICACPPRSPSPSAPSDPTPNGSKDGE